MSIPLLTQVFVAGEVFSPGKVPYDPALRVGDYIIASGGINPLRGDPNSIWFVNKLGQRTQAGLGSPVVPGAVILVDQNTWTKTQQFMADVGVVASFITVLVTVLTDAIDFYNLLPKK